MKADTVPLFTLPELAAAFAQLLPRDDAERWAKEWFSRFADTTDVDSSGRYLYHRPEDLDESPEIVIAAQRESDEVRPDPLWLSRHRGMSVDEKAERLLMGFSDLHLYLLVLVSPEMEKRVQLIYGDSDESAVRRRAKALELVNALRHEPQ